MVERRKEGRRIAWRRKVERRKVGRSKEWEEEGRE